MPGNVSPPPRSHRLPAQRSPWLENGYQQHALAPACSPDAEHCAWLVRPDLDDAVFRERWPAVDAVNLTRGPHVVQVFLNGDAVTLHVRDRAGEADPAQAEQIRQEPEGALAEPREIDVYLGGELLRFVFAPKPGDRYAVDRMLEITNTLLEHVGSSRRLVRLDEPHVIAMQVPPR